MIENTQDWTQKYSLFKGFDLFSSMPDEQLADMARVAGLHLIAKGQFAPYADDPTSYAYFVKQGHLKVTRLGEDHKEVILDIVGPGEFIYHLGLPLGNTRSEVIEAIDPVKMCVYRRSDFELILNRHESLSRAVQIQIGERQERITTRLIDMVFRDAKQRIACVLLRLADQFGEHKESVIRVSIPLSHQEIAYLTGTSRQSVTSVLNHLRNEGAVDFSRRFYEIHRRDALRIAAGINE
jgi:CRP/FNR family transcriptional regulator